MKWTYPEGATPLTLSEIQGLIPTHIRFQHELNEWEQENILKANLWLMKRPPQRVLSMEFLQMLHRRMFSQTWTWAGSFRQTEKNIGFSSYLIPIELKKLLDDVVFQRESNAWSQDEIGVRFHHRLVLIHAFSNGNGRHARLMTDLLMKEMGGRVFTWGSDNLTQSSKIRQEYIKSLREADAGNIKPLLIFARS